MMKNLDFNPHPQQITPGLNQLYCLWSVWVVLGQGLMQLFELKQNLSLLLRPKHTLNPGDCSNANPAFDLVDTMYVLTGIQDRISALRFVGSGALGILNHQLTTFIAIRLTQEERHRQICTYGRTAHQRAIRMPTIPHPHFIPADDKRIQFCRKSNCMK